MRCATMPDIALGDPMPDIFSKSVEELVREVSSGVLTIGLRELMRLIASLPG